METNKISKQENILNLYYALKEKGDLIRIGTYDHDKDCCSCKIDVECTCGMSMGETDSIEIAIYRSVKRTWLFFYSEHTVVYDQDEADAVCRTEKTTVIKKELDSVKGFVFADLGDWTIGMRDELDVYYTNVRKRKIDDVLTS